MHNYMDRLKTVSLSDDDDIRIDIKDDKNEYKTIKDNTGRDYLNSILIKAGFFDEVGEDPDNYHYICDRDKCDEVWIYYYEKEEHNKTYHNNKCCVIS